MNYGQTTQNIKPNLSRKAIGSLVTGMLSAVLPIGGLSHFAYLFETPPQFLVPIGKILYHSPCGMICDYIFPLFGFFLSIIGLILGIKSLKSSKRKLAILGVIFSLIGLSEVIYFSYLIL